MGKRLLVVAFVTLVLMPGCSEYDSPHRQIANPEDQHPSHSLLLRFAEGDAEWSELVDVVRHISECDRCSHRVRLLSLHAEARKNKE